MAHLELEVFPMVQEPSGDMTLCADHEAQSWDVVLSRVDLEVGLKDPVIEVEDLTRDRAAFWATALGRIYQVEPDWVS